MCIGYVCSTNLSTYFERFFESHRLMLGHLKIINKTYENSVESKQSIFIHPQKKKYSSRCQLLISTQVSAVCA